MLICLLIFEILLVGLIILTHNMIGRKYKEIEDSVTIYTSKRAYKTQEKIAFIDLLIKRYQQFIEREEQLPDLDSMIKNSLLKEHIGNFTFIGVNNVAHKSKYIMWGIIVLEGAIAAINGVTTTFESIVVIITSILLAIIIEVFSIIKALEEKQDALIVLVEDYILNTYPIAIQDNKYAIEPITDREIEYSAGKEDRRLNLVNEKEDKQEIEENRLKSKTSCKHLEQGQESKLITLTKQTQQTPIYKERLKQEENKTSYSSNIKSVLTEKDIAKLIKELR